MFGTAFASTPFASQSEIRFLIDGVSALGVTNSVTISADANVPVTTPTLTSSVGSVVVVADANAAVTGVSATASTNTVTITAAANVVPTGVSATVSLGLVQSRTTNVIPITTPALTVNTNSVTVVNTNFDYDSLQDSYDRKRVVFISGTPQNFTVVIPSDKKQRTVSIAAIDRDNTIRIAA